MPELPPLAVIAGPTASGKSAMALAMAQATNGVVVNADSAQVYRDLQILSARPSRDDERRADHRLYGTRDGADACSAAGWADDARAVIAAAHAEHRLPILVGGTGLYLRTLLDGIAPIPPVDARIRAEVRATSVIDNHRALTAEDPAAAAALGAADSQRVARALEVVRSTGRSMLSWRGERHGGIGGQVRVAGAILLPPREWLRERCDARFAQIVADGVTEVEALLARGLDPTLPVMRAIGVREIADWRAGNLSRAGAVAQGQAATRQYAKRQYTWFRNQPPPAWTRIERPWVAADVGALAAACAWR